MCHIVSADLYNNKIEFFGDVADFLPILELDNRLLSKNKAFFGMFGEGMGVTLVCVFLASLQIAAALSIVRGANALASVRRGDTKLPPPLRGVSIRGSRGVGTTFARGILGMGAWIKYIQQ